MDREVRIVHLYPDVMNLYGEYANLAVLRRHLETLDIAVLVEKVLYEDSTDFAAADFIYMGAGTERAQKAVLTCLPELAESLKGAVGRGVPLLFTGNAMEILGVSVTDANGKVWPALGLADFTTAETDRRDPGDVIAHTPLLDSPVVGFMNKCSLTAGVASPLFARLSLGFGNEAPNGPEGYAEGSILATHLTGPVLVKNPALLEMVIRRLFAYKGWDVPEPLPALPYEREAWTVTLRELQGRVQAGGPGGDKA